MSRLEFSRVTRREALRRSGQICEAVGPTFGLAQGERCMNRLKFGVEFHHAVEAEMGGDKSLGNCLALCIKCHRFVSRTFIQELRHSDRVRDRDQGIIKPRSKLSKEYRREVMRRYVRTGEGR